MIENKEFSWPDYDDPSASRGAAYALLMELARKHLAEHRLSTVRECIARAIATDPARPSELETVFI